MTLKIISFLGKHHLEFKIDLKIENLIGVVNYEIEIVIIHMEKMEGR